MRKIIREKLNVDAGCRPSKLTLAPLMAPQTEAESLTD
jgi:hypothetical protein